jgi:hypothetical protein
LANLLKYKLFTGRDIQRSSSIGSKNKQLSGAGRYKKEKYKWFDL